MTAIPHPQSREAPPPRNRRRAVRWFADHGLGLLLLVYALAVSGFAIWQMNMATEARDELISAYMSDQYHKETGFKYRLADLDDVRLNALEVCVEAYRREHDIGIWPVDEMYEVFMTCQERLSRAR